MDANNARQLQIKWKAVLPRQNQEIVFDRVIVTFLGVVIAINLFNLYQTAGIATAHEVRVLAALSMILAFILPPLWRGQRWGIASMTLFYFLQIPATIAIGTFFYDIDGGLRVSLGYLNDNFIFNFFFFHTGLSAGFLNPETDGMAYGFVVNVAAAVLAIYYYRRLRKFQSQPNS